MSIQRHNLPSRWRRLLTAAAVLCACVWFSPRQADASCGDYVMAAGHSHGAADHNVRLKGGGVEKPVGFPICNGPGCRQRREAPASPSTRITLDEHSWGLPPRLVSPTPELVSLGDLSTDPAVAISVAAGVFRPPRA